MDLTLTPIEARVLGCLVEKEATTSDNYPLSLNALTTACNQKTSRDPVMDLSESTVQDAIDTLIRKTLVAARSVSGSRVAKYAHRLRDRLNPEYSFEPDELALMALLFLRGAQTRGELRTRSARLHQFADTAEVDAALRKLAQRDDGPYVTELPVSAGHKEARFAHLACGDIEIAPALADPAQKTGPVGDDAARIATLELELRRLRAEFNETRAAFEDFRRQFD